ncbi:transcriptional factor nfil3 e4bp4, partial [Schistosoma japonicum]
YVVSDSTLTTTFNSLAGIDKRYQDRRRRNNEAVRRCRENKRARLLGNGSSNGSGRIENSEKLQSENRCLRSELTGLSMEVKALHHEMEMNEIGNDNYLDNNVSEIPKLTMSIDNSMDDVNSPRCQLPKEHIDCCQKKFSSTTSTIISSTLSDDDNNNNVQYSLLPDNEHSNHVDPNESEKPATNILRGRRRTLRKTSIHNKNTKVNISHHINHHQDTALDTTDMIISSTTQTINPNNDNDDIDLSPHPSIHHKQHTNTTNNNVIPSNILTTNENSYILPDKKKPNYFQLTNEYCATRNSGKEDSILT